MERRVYVVVVVLSFAVMAMLPIDTFSRKTSCVETTSRWLPCLTAVNLASIPAQQQQHLVNIFRGWLWHFREGFNDDKIPSPWESVLRIYSPPLWWIPKSFYSDTSDWHICEEINDRIACTQNRTSKLLSHEFASNRLRWMSNEFLDNLLRWLTDTPDVSINPSWKRENVQMRWPFFCQYFFLL